MQWKKHMMLTEESWAGRTFHDSAGSQIKTPGLVDMDGSEDSI